jgi:predicted hotdog family 3-hydroxylacyl-ACP dehydratase
MMKPSLPRIEDVIAHRGNMLLLEKLSGIESETCSAEYTPQRDAWYADAAGNMPAWVGLELMAQTIAAYVGMQKFTQGTPAKQGVLLGTRSYKSKAPSFTAGQCLRMQVRVSFRDESGLGAFDCNIQLAATQEVLATALLKVYEPDDFNVFMKESQL